jgi:hypothetical protein
MRQRYFLAAVIGLLSVAAGCGNHFPQRLLPAMRSAAAGVCHIGENAGGPRRSVALIFEEQHLSRAAQIQEAISLVRLHREVGLRHIVVEGYLEDRPPIRTDWAAVRGRNEPLFLDVATVLLREGDISAAEFLNLAFDDVVLHPGESSRQHSPELDAEAAAAPFQYLLATAQKGLDPSRAAKAHQMLNEALNADSRDANARFQQVIEFVLAADQWAAAKGRRLQAGRPLSTSEGVSLLQEIQGRATRAGVAVSSQDSEAMDRALVFWRARKDADRTLGNAANALGAQPDVKWAAVTLGAAHTSGVIDVLRRAGQPYAVLTPLVLKTGDRRGDLDREALQRRYAGQAVHPGALATWIEQAFPAAQKKPEPWLATVRGQVETEIRMFVGLVVGQARDSGTASLTAEDLRGTYVSVDPAGIKIIPQADAPGGSVVEFPITILTSATGTARTMWVRAVYTGSDAGNTETDASGIENRLEGALHDLLEEKPVPASQLELVPVTPAIHAVFAPSPLAFSASAAGIWRR